MTKTCVPLVPQVPQILNSSNVIHLQRYFGIKKKFFN